MKNKISEKTVTLEIRKKYITLDEIDLIELERIITDLDEKDALWAPVVPPVSRVI